jgi:CPA1 family monovalent cation:H+ antiporter
VEALRAALLAAESCPGAEAAALVRRSYALQLRRAEEQLARGGVPARPTSGEAVTPAEAPCDIDGGDGDAAVVRAATGAQRRRLVALRADGTIGDAAFQRVEEELDWSELGWAQVLPPEPRAGGAA